MWRHNNEPKTQGNPSVSQGSWVFFSMMLSLGPVATLVFACIVTVFLSSGIPNSVAAEESVIIEPPGERAKLPNRLSIRGGWGHIFGADTTLRFNGLLGFGTTIDFDSTLGGETDGNQARVDALYRFSRNHSVGVTWYKVSRTGSKMIDEQIKIDDLIIRAGAQVNSELDITLYRALYNWSFYQNDKVELAISPGIYLANISTTLAANLTIQEGDQSMNFQPDVQKEELTVPLPSVGGLVNYHILPRLTAQVRADWFWIGVGDFAGSMLEFYAGLEYRLFDNLSIGAAYDRLVVDVENNSPINGFKVDNDWNMVFGYAALYFFDVD